MNATERPTDRPTERPPWPATNGHRPAGLTIDQAAAELGLSREAVRHRVRRGTLAGERVNGQWRVHIGRPRPARRPTTERPDERPAAEREIVRLEELVGVLKAEAGELRGELGWFRQRLEEAETAQAEMRRLLLAHAPGTRALAGPETPPEPHTATPARRRPWWRRLFGAH